MKPTILCLLIFYSSFSIAQTDTLLKTYSKSDLLADYDLAVSSLKESHPGLYWYTKYADYERIFNANRNMISDGMNSYDFFRIISRIVSADREGHSDVYRSSNIADYVNTKAKLLPFAVIPVDSSLYVLNNINKHQTEGLVITKIDGVDIDSIVTNIFRHQSKWSDGYSVTGKYQNIEYFNFSFAYHYYIDALKSDSTTIELQNPDTKELKTYTVPLIKREDILRLAKITPYVKRKTDDLLFNLEIRPNSKTATLTFNDFGYDRYEKKNTTFKAVVDSLFTIIKNRGIKDLIIDVRNNSGGSEGAEDYLFSYLAAKEYKKYKYVEAKAFNFSFLKNTNYSSDEDKKELEEMLVTEHYLASDGRILRKKEVLPTEKPQKAPYKGRIYILISGKTFSGGSEFAAIAKDQSKAIFIGEETGGAFYGQTSGSYIHLFLPITDVHIRIPLLKFVTTFESDNIPFGRGVIPDYKITQSFREYTNGIDAQLNFAFKLIDGKN